MRPVGAVRLVPGGRVYKQIFEAEVKLKHRLKTKGGRYVCQLLVSDLKSEVQLVRSLDEARNRTRFPIKSDSLTLVRDSETSTDARLLPCYQQKCVEGAPYNNSLEKPPPLDRQATTFEKAWESVDVNAAEEVRGLPDIFAPEEGRSNISGRLRERRRGRHGTALASLYQELGSIAREMDPFVLEPGKFLLTKLMESDRKIELLFEKIECEATQEGFSVEGLEELWSTIQQEFLTRKKWIREMDESLKKVERSRADRITAVLRKYTVRLEEISFLLLADVHRFMNDEAMMINRALLANQRAITQLFFNLMKSEMKKELSHQLKWQDTVKDWKLIQKNYIVHSFREFMANEEIQNPPTVRTEMENMIMDQILLSGRRLELLQHLGDLLPPTHTKAEINEWYTSVVNLNKNMDHFHVQCVMKIRSQYEMVQEKCLAEVQLCKNNLLNLNVCTKREAEEFVNSELLHLTERLKSQFEEELEHMNRDFEELAKQDEQNCRDLYSYVQEAMGLWDVHQLRLSQQEEDLQKKLDECRGKRDDLIQTMEADLDVILGSMKTASSEEMMKKTLENALSSLDDIRARYEMFNQVLTDEVMAYPEAILQELISYSISISQYFNVKEVFKQNLKGEIDSTSQGNTSRVQIVSEAEHLVKQQTERVVQENEGEQRIGSCQQENEEPSTADNEEILAQGAEATEEKKDWESVPHESEETEHAEQGVSLTQEEKHKGLKIATETFSTSSGNSYTVLGVEKGGKAEIPENYFTKYEKEESLPMYLNYALIRENVFVELKKRIRLCFFEHLEKWFTESLSNSHVFVAAKKEELNSELQLHLHLHQRRQENIETDVYHVRAAELLLHKESLESHCAGVVEALEKERAEFNKFWDQQNNSIKNLHSRIREMESVFLSAPVTEKFISFSNAVHSELQNQLEVIQVSLRSYRDYLEEALGELRDSNVNFLRACRLFMEGGNFSPEEVKSVSKSLQGESKHIDSFESLIKTKMEKMESSCLKQATELITESEQKFHCIFKSRVFMEKIQQFLRNLQVQIKSEVAKSNLQARTLNSYLEKLHQNLDASAHPTADKEALTSEELYELAKVLLTELKKRSQYLDCLLVKPTILYENEDFTPLASNVTLQGPLAVAVRTQSHRDENKLLVMGLDPDKFPVLNPSRMGKSAIGDLSISVIKNILGIELSRKSSGLYQSRSDRSCHLRAVNLPTSKKSSHLDVSGVTPQNSATNTAQLTKKSSVRKKVPKRRKQKCIEPVLSDKEFWIFEEKPPESDTFKGIIMNILWMGNNSLLCLAEEFYQNKQPHMTIPEDLPETIEHLAAVLKQNLLSYQSQTDNYYNSCLIEFQEQLKLFEKELPYVSQLTVEGLLKEHEQKLIDSTGQIWHLFNKQLEGWENMKTVHKNQLHPSLGHPDNVVQLDALCQEEIKRQKDQADDIHLNTQKLQDCAAECAQNFFSALAAFTEKLLLELDETITIDDVQVAKTEVPREKTSTLIRQKQAGLLEISEVKQLTERGGRTWPGIPMTTLADNSGFVLCRGTASVTTAKTTLGHVAAVEARDAAYKKYKCKLEQHFAQIKEESRAQLLRAQHWEDWWEQSVQKIKQLYT